VSISSTKIPTLNQVRISDRFWLEYVNLVRDVVVPYQWEALNDRIPDAEPSRAVRNFKIAAGEEQGEFYGMVFQDSDVGKWLEAVGYLLASRPDPELEKTADALIDTIAKAQQPDGYLNTYFTLKEPEGRWTNLAECHELYCAGHLMEAAVAYYEGTGKRKLLDVMCRYADYIDTVFGPEPGKLQGYDGHQEVELALVKLYKATYNENYLRLGKFFIDQRGAKPNFYEIQLKERGGQVHYPQLDIARHLPYSQSHLPVREQDTAEGHAVRVVYMCAGMADIARETGDRSLLEASRRLWKNIVDRRMYITGGIGSMEKGESFTFDYDLPNDTVYAETCASIGLIFFAHRMLQLEPKSEYADTMERALYNTVLSGMSKDGRHFFYVNPLESYPAAHGKNAIYDHVKPERQGWFGCACCPPNVARLLGSLGQYIYTLRDDTLFAHLYIGSRMQWSVDDGSVAIEQETGYPWEGDVRFRVTTDKPSAFSLALRIPDWCDEYLVRVNGELLGPDESRLVDGYETISRRWSDGDTVELVMSMPAKRMFGHPLIRQTAGKTAVQRGPLVYCLEEADNGPHLHEVVLPKHAKLAYEFDADLLGGIGVVTAEGARMKRTAQAERLYEPDVSHRPEPVALRFIPYYAWANRGQGEMAVWIRMM